MPLSSDTVTMQFHMLKKCLRLALFTLLLASFSVPAQETPAQEAPARAAASADAELISSKLAEVEASTKLSDTAKATLVDLYRRSLTNLERAKAERAKEDEFAAAAAEAPQALATVNKTLDQRRATEADSRIAIPADATLPELEGRLADERKSLSEADARLAELRQRYAAEVVRPEEARQRLAAASDEQGQTADELSVPAPVGDSADLTEARRWQLESRAYRLAAEISKLDQELLTHTARLELLQARQDLETAAVAEARTSTRRLEDAINERRGVAAELARQEATAAQQALEGRHATIRELAAGNVELSQRQTARVQDLQRASEERDAVRLEVMRISEELSSTQSRLAIAGVNQALGQLLIEHRRALPNRDTLRKRAKQLQEQVAAVGLEQYELTEQRRSLRNIEGFVDKLASDIVAEDIEDIRSELGTLADVRHELVRKSVDTGARYLRVLSELDLAVRELEGVARDYDEFLAQRLLWIRNTQPIKVEALDTFYADLQHMTSASEWSQFAQGLLTSLQARPHLAFAFIALLLLAALRNRVLAAIETRAKSVGRIRTDRFRYSIDTLVFTALAAAPLPLVLIAVGLLVNSYVQATPFSSAVATSLMAVGADLLFIQFFIESVRDDGLAIRHCHWTARAAEKLRTELRWFRVVFPITRFIGETSFALEGGSHVGGLAALTLFLAAGSLGMLIVRLLTPSGGVLQDYLRKHPDSTLARLRPIWTAALIAVLPVLMLLWFTGYNYTADVVSVSFMYSIWLLLGLVLLLGFLARWLMLGYQRLALKAAIEKRDAARAAREADEDEASKSSPEEADLDVEEPEIDFAALDSDRQRLLRTIVGLAAVVGLWVIWAPLIPALGFIDQVSLWTATRVVGGEMVVTPVTLADVLLAVIVLLVTGAAARGLPSFVEFRLLQRTNITAGARYTATTLLRYAIVAVGVIVVFGILGARWSQIQWLVAALGVGIGFGLQEIVANFISGLIILFERPIRIGDVVSVGNTSGVVTRINIRATTIRDWDRKELLVPNKEFVTGRLLNWTLSDDILRLMLPVGIQYGSDVGLAMMLAEQVALDNDNVVEDPKPFVVFEGFGDNSLNLSLRAYVPSVGVLMQTKTELHSAINDKLTEAGIVIAFPQRDVHLDTSKPLEIRMQTT